MMVWKFFYCLTGLFVVLGAATQPAAGGDADMVDGLYDDVWDDNPPAGFERWHRKTIEYTWDDDLDSAEIDWMKERGWRLIDIEHHMQEDHIQPNRFCGVFVHKKWLYEADWHYVTNWDEETLRVYCRNGNWRIIDLERGSYGGTFTAVLVQNSGVQKHSWGFETGVIIDELDEDLSDLNLGKLYRWPIDIECGSAGNKYEFKVDYVWVDEPISESKLFRIARLADVPDLEHGKYSDFQVVDIERTPESWFWYEPYPYLVIYATSFNNEEYAPHIDTEEIDFVNDIYPMQRLIDIEPHPNTTNDFTAVWADLSWEQDE